MTQSHHAWCKYFNGHSDAAKRVSDTYNLHRIGAGYGAIGKWFAVRLDDGTSDNVLYDDKYSCVIHQGHNEQFYTFVKICPSDMDPCEAEVMLVTAQNMYKAGMRMADPDHKHGGPDLMKRLAVEDQLAMLRGVARNLRLPQKGST